MTITCNCESGGKCEIHPKPKQELHAVKVLPNTAQDVIDFIPLDDAHDKLTLKILEAKSLKSQLEARDAQQQLQAFVGAMYAKHNLKYDDWTFDLGKLGFTQNK